MHSVSFQIIWWTHFVVCTHDICQQVLRPQVQVQVQVPRPQVRVQVQVLRSQVQVQVLQTCTRVQVQVPSTTCLLGYPGTFQNSTQQKQLSHIAHSTRKITYRYKKTVQQKELIMQSTS